MEVDDDIRQIALRGKRVRAIQLLRERTGVDFNEANAAVNALLPERHRSEVRGVPLWLLGGILLAVVASTLVGLLAAVNKLPVLLRPAMVLLERVVRPLSPLIFRPEVPLVAGALVLAVALPRARRYRRPARFRTGIIAIALALATFWPLQYVAAALDLGYPEYNMVLHGLGFFVSICLLTGGIEGVRRANDSPGQDSWEFLR
jgi:hypothetical protein